MFSENKNYRKDTNLKVLFCCKLLSGSNKLLEHNIACNIPWSFSIILMTMS